MSHKIQKQYLRRASRRRWLDGRLKNGLSMPTEEEVACFLTGFNMGYHAYKTKEVKDLRLK